jgi:hypothetical protein
MGIDSAFSTMDSLTQTDAERRAKEQEQAAQSEAGAITLKDMLKMPDALKVRCLLAHAHVHAHAHSHALAHAYAHIRMYVCTYILRPN